MCNNYSYTHTELLYKACSYITLMTHKNVMIYNRISQFFSFQFKTTRKWPTKVSLNTTLAVSMKSSHILKC